jgi:hypothetical protein
MEYEDGEEHNGTDHEEHEESPFDNLVSCVIFCISVKVKQTGANVTIYKLFTVFYGTQ